MDNKMCAFSLKSLGKMVGSTAELYKGLDEETSQGISMMLYEIADRILVNEGEIEEEVHA